MILFMVRNFSLYLNILVLIGLMSLDLSDGYQRDMLIFCLYLLFCFVHFIMKLHGWTHSGFALI